MKMKGVFERGHRVCREVVRCVHLARHPSERSRAARARGVPRIGGWLFKFFLKQVFLSLSLIITMLS